MNWMIKTTSLCFSISSVWKLVTRKEMSYPCHRASARDSPWKVTAGRQFHVRKSHLDRLPPQDEERLGPLRQKASKLVDEDVLDLVGLLDLDADANAVNAGLDQDQLVLVARDGQRRQEHLGRR